MPDLETTLFLAFSHGHPGLTERSLDRAALLTLHRQAWNIGGLQEDDPWRHLLQIPDPVERVAVASQAGFPLSEADLSSLVLEAVASQKGDEKRSAVALIIYLKFRAAKKIAATAAETLAGQLGNILRPRRTTHQVYGTALERCRRVASLCSTLRKTPRDQYIRNLLNGFLPDGYKSVQPEELKVFAFSTVVSEIRGSDLRRASFANTQGTAINAVLNHAVSISTGRQPKVILVVTDGYVGPARSDLLTRIPKTRTVAALTAPGYEADLKP